MHTGIVSQFIRDLEEVVSGMSNNADSRRVSTTFFPPRIHPLAPSLAKEGEKDKPNLPFTF